MFKVKGLLAGIIAAVLLTNSPVVFAHAGNDSADEVLGYYETENGVNPIMEEAGVAEQLPDGMTLKELLDKNPPKPEIEARLVHREPKVPFILDGIRYEPKQIHLFDGQRLGFSIGKDGCLYACTDSESIQDFLNEQTCTVPKSRSLYSYFYDFPYYGGPDSLSVLPNTALYSLATMDNLISSLKVSTYATSGCTLFEYENLQGDYLNIPSGTNRPDLGSYGWDNRASSMVVWP